MANNFNTNPIRIDGTMASAWLAQSIGGVTPSAGLERPLKVTKIVVEGNITAGTLTIGDGSTAANTLFEQSFPTAANTNSNHDFAVPVPWRNFQVTAIPAGSITWIYHR